MAKVTKSVPIALIAGYLGAGKTTLLNNILKDPHGHKVAVIVNDIGEVNIDADLIAKGGTVQQQDNSLVPLSNGCICCTLQTDLMDQIAQLCATGNFDYILIEASGICEPLPIAQTIMQMGEICRQRNIPEICHLDNIISVADTLRLAQEFNCGVDFEENRQQYEEEENLASLIIQQIEFSNIVIMNKAELVSEENKAKIKKVINALAPAAKIVEATYGNVDIDELLDTNYFDFEKNYYSLGWVKAIEDDAKEKEEKKHHHDHDDEDEDEHEHHHHHHDDDEDEHEHHHHHHDDDDDDEDEHEHHHEHHYDENGVCSCGHHHHHADEVFSSWGKETTVSYTKEEMEKILACLENEEQFGLVLRAKGIVKGEEGWIHFDYIPDGIDVRSGSADVIGKICVIGSKINEEALAKLFKLN